VNENVVLYINRYQAAKSRTFCSVRDLLNQPRVKEANVLTGTPLETPFAEGKHEGKAAMPLGSTGAMPVG